MANTMLDNAIVTIYNTGFFDYFLPFMVTFAILYGILQKMKILGEQNKQLNPVFALIISLMIMPFLANLNYITYLSKLLFVIFKLFVIFMILGLLGYKFEHKNNGIIFALIAGAFIVITEFFKIDSFSKLSSETIYALIAILLFGFIVWLIVGKSPKENTIKETNRLAKPEEKKKQPESKPQIKQQAKPEDYDVQHIGSVSGEDLEKKGFKFGK